MRAYSCERCGWATDEASADWDRFSQLQACPRCETKREGESLPVALFWSLPRPTTTAGRWVWLIGLSFLLGAVNAFVGFGPLRPYITGLGSLAVVLWVFSSRPDRSP